MLKVLQDGRLEAFHLSCDHMEGDDHLTIFLNLLVFAVSLIDNIEAVIFVLAIPLDAMGTVFVKFPNTLLTLAASKQTDCSILSDEGIVLRTFEMFPRNSIPDNEVRGFAL